MYTRARSLLVAATEPERLPKGLGNRVLYVDAEDGTRSNWCRFINHAPEPECNLRCRSLAADMHGNPRIWFVALRDIEAGEELLYDYGDNYWGELYKD